MTVLLDAEAVARRDSFTMLFWGALVSTAGNSGLLALIRAAGFVVVVLALTRLRRAATDRAYRSRVGVAIASAGAAVPFAVVHAFAGRADSVPEFLLDVALLLLALVHTCAVIGAMSRLAESWAADRLRQHWSRAFRLTIGSAIALVAVGFAVGGPGVYAVLTVAVGLLIALAALVQYLVAIWQMRSAMQRAARVPLPA